MKSCKEYARPLLASCVAVLAIRLCIFYRSGASAEFDDANRNVRDDDLMHQRSNATVGDALIACDVRHGENPLGVDFGCEFNPKNVKASETKQMTIPEFYEYEDRGARCSHRFDDTVMFFHPGKSGGGTLKRNLEIDRVGVKPCHPRPQRCTHTLQRGPRTTLITTVRDPVDRFASAFRWRLAYLLSDFRSNVAAACDPDDEGRRKKCVQAEADREEEEMLFGTYGADPNLFMKALCEGHELHKNALADFSEIHHSMPLSEWLRFLIDPRMAERITEDGIKKFIAVPMEKRGDGGEMLFERHIEQLSLYLLETRYEREVAEEILRQKPPDDEKGKQMCEHSSVRYHDVKNTSVPSEISPLGECCLARYLRDDYRLIRTMIGDDATKRKFAWNRKGAAVEPLADAHPVIGAGCSWGSEEQQHMCRSDLRSMLMRRAKYLDRSLGTCSKVVAKMGH